MKANEHFVVQVVAGTPEGILFLNWKNAGFDITSFWNHSRIDAVDKETGRRLKRLNSYLCNNSNKLWASSIQQQNYPSIWNVSCLPKCPCWCKTDLSWLYCCSVDSAISKFRSEVCQPPRMFIALSKYSEVLLKQTWRVFPGCWCWWLRVCNKMPVKTFLINFFFDYFDRIL